MRACMSDYIRTHPYMGMNIYLGICRYYHVAFSTDFGKSFTRPAPLRGAGCARPRVKRLRGGPLLMDAGPTTAPRPRSPYRR